MVERLERGPEHLAIIVPAYNESENLEALIARITSAMDKASVYEIVIVDDGSRDESASLLPDLASRYPQMGYVVLASNVGQQNALRAGLGAVEADCYVFLDADLQHPPELIEQLVARWREGFDVVNAIRRRDRRTPIFKRTTSAFFYRFLSWLSGYRLETGSSDFRLIDRKVAERLKAMPEVDIFYRGLIPQMGVASANVAYQPDPRHAGRSKYSYTAMLRLALRGVLSSTVKPLRLAIVFAIATASAAGAFLLYVLFQRFFGDGTVAGWASTLTVVLIIGAMQLLVLGVIGEYLGQVLKETRRRPPYIVERTRLARLKGTPDDA